MSRGLHIALTEDELATLRAAGDDDARRAALFAIEDAAFPGGRAQESDKAWFAIHLALTGKMPLRDADRSTYPLDRVIMGGEKIFGADDFIMRLIAPAEVADAAPALAAIDDGRLRDLYDARCNIDDYLDYGDEDFEYTLSWFEGVKEFFAREAGTGRHVLFSVDR